MKTILMLLLSSFGVISPTINNLGMTATQENVSLTIDVSGVKERKGKLQVALFNSPDGFPGKAKPYRAEVLNITANNQLQVVFKNLPPGDYAVAVYHDKNGNGKLDKNLVGMPVEDYGFSNDTRGTRLGAPSFEDTKVPLTEADAQVAIEVR